jgi:hypothetical protein
VEHRAAVVDEVVPTLGAAAAVRERLGGHDAEDVVAATGRVVGGGRVGSSDPDAHDERERREQEDEAMHRDPLIEKRDTSDDGAEAYIRQDGRRPLLLPRAGV